MRRLRVAVSNVQSGLGTTRGWWDYVATLRHRILPRSKRHIERIGEALRCERVDIAIFTEVDGGSTRTAGIDQADLLAEAGGWHGHAFFPCLRIGKRICQGNAIHARCGVRHVRNHPLSGLGEPRFLSEALVDLPDGPLRVFAAHTSLDFAVRREQLQEIRDIVAQRRGPVLLGGDFNTRHSLELDHLSRALHRIESGPTFPSWRPRWALDHLFASEHFETLAVRVLHGVRASDHLPVMAEVSLAADSRYDACESGE